MKRILSFRKQHYVAPISILLIFLITVALIAGMVGCGGREEEEEKEEFRIQDWDDLNSGRDKLGADYVWILENDLDRTTPGWNETASRTADAGKGWKPIGSDTDPFKGTFDGNGYTISDLYIYRPEEDEVGLFGRVQGSDQGGVIKNLGLVNVNVTGREFVGALVGYNWKGTLDSETRPPDSKTYSRGSVTGEENVGGLVGDNYGGTINQCESSADVFICVAPGEDRFHAGGLVGLNSGPVLNCKYNGEVQGDLRVGGLVGMNERLPAQVGLLEGCCSDAYNVNGTSVVGGVVGRNFGVVRRCSRPEGDTGNLTAQCLVALNEGATGNADSSDMALPGSYFGSFMGVNEVEGIVEECSTGAGTTVVGGQSVGAFVGWNRGTVTGCNCSGDVTGSVDVGQFAGYNTGTVSYPESTSCVTGAIDCGPLVGRNEGHIRYNLTVSSTGGGSVTTPGEATFTYDEGEVINLVAEADEGYHFVNWTGDVGTIAHVEDATTTIAMSSDYSITANFEEGPAGVAVQDWYDLDAIRDNWQDSYVLMNDLNSTTAGYAELASPAANGGKGWEPLARLTGSFDGQGYEIRDVFIDRPDEDYVGLFGCFGTGEGRGVIRNVGLVHLGVTGRSVVGGLVALNSGTVSNSYSTGSVTGEISVGGVVGINYGGTVSNSYSTGSVTGQDILGGLAGGNHEGTVSNSYSTGSVTGDYEVGGLVGINDQGTVGNSFWDTQTSGQATSDGGTGKTTAEMHDMGAFAAAGWDICGVAPGETNPGFVWNIVDGETYPFLSWES